MRDHAAGPAGDDPGAGQRRRPLRPGPGARRRRRHAAGPGRGRRRPDHVHARTPTSSARRRSTTRSRTPAAASSGRRTGQVTVDVIGRPLPPGAPSAVADNATAVVTWSPAEGNGAGVDGYEVQGGGQTLSTGGSTTATFSGLTNGVPVQFTVRAHNAAGWSEWSAPSPAVTPDVVPGRPAAPTVQFGNGQLDGDVVPAGQRGQRDQQLQPRDRRQRRRDPRRRQPHDLRLGRPPERRRVHVPGPGRQPEGRGRVERRLGRPSTR